MYKPGLMLEVAVCVALAHYFLTALDDALKPEPETPQRVYQGRFIEGSPVQGCPVLPLSPGWIRL